VVSFPQAMISRPLVAATLAGALCGDAAGGLLVGATLELIALETLPFGASRYPEWGSAAVVGGALFSVQATQHGGALALAVFGALATAWIGGWSMVQLRRANGRWAARRRDKIAAGSRRDVMWLQLLGMTVDLLRGAVLTVIAYAVLAPIADACLALWPPDAHLARAVVVAVAASVTGGAAWKLFHSVKWARWFFVGGLAVGLSMWVWV
jgi:PTS system mannose-specific IIC component